MSGECLHGARQPRVLIICRVRRPGVLSDRRSAECAVFELLMLAIDMSVRHVVCC